MGSIVTELMLIIALIILMIVLDGIFRLKERNRKGTPLQIHDTQTKICDGQPAEGSSEAIIRTLQEISGS